MKRMSYYIVVVVPVWIKESQTFGGLALHEMSMVS